MREVISDFCNFTEKKLTAKITVKMLSLILQNTINRVKNIIWLKGNQSEISRLQKPQLSLCNTMKSDLILPFSNNSNTRV